MERKGHPWVGQEHQWVHEVVAGTNVIGVEKREKEKKKKQPLPLPLPQPQPQPPSLSLPRDPPRVCKRACVRNGPLWRRRGGDARSSVVGLEHGDDSSHSASLDEE